MPFIIPGPVIGTGGHTFDAAYNGGTTVTADAGPVTFNNTSGDTAHILVLNKSPSGSAPGNALEVTMGANASGHGVHIAHAGTGQGLLLDDDVTLAFGSSVDATLAYNTTQTTDSVVLGVGVDSNTFVICQQGDVGFDFAHGLNADPILVIHSANQTTDEFISITHDQTSGVINAGTGGVSFASAITFVGPATAQFGLAMQSDITLRDGDQIIFGTGGDASILYSSVQTPDSLLLAVGADSNSVVICQAADIGFDFAHNQTDPTVFVHSVNQATDEWVSLSHNQTHGVLSVGTGDLLVTGAAALRVGTDTTLGFGTSGSLATLALRSGQTPDSLVASLPTTSRSLVVCEHGDHGFDFAHAQETNPTLFIHSANQSTTEWFSCTHDQTDAVLEAGTGNIRLATNLARTVTDGISASTTQSQGEQPLTADINFVTVVANPDDVVTMQAVVAGLVIRIINEGTNRLQIFPASGDDVGNGVNASTAICAGATATFVGTDGTTWSLVSEIDGPLAHMQQNRNTTAFVIAAQNQHHSYHSATVSAPHLEGWTFDAGGGGTPVAYTVVADGGSGVIDVTAATHGLAVGDIVSMTNSSPADPNYDKVHVVTAILSADIFSVVTTFGATATGTVNQAATLECDPGAEGDYKIIWSASTTPAGTNETFDWLLYTNDTEEPTSETRRKLGTGGDFGSVAWPTILTFAVGDKVSWAMQNTSSANNITIRHFGLVLDRSHR